jgi:hypothetical protein
VSAKCSQPEQDHADVDHGQVVDAAFLVACRNAPGLLQAIDQTFDFVALAVGLAVEVGLTRLVFAAWDHRLDVALSHASPGSWAAVAFVASRLTWSQTRTAMSRTADRTLVEHRFQSDLLVPLAASQYHGDRPSVAFGTQMHLGRKTALAAA